MAKFTAVRRAFGQFLGGAVGFRADAGLGIVGSPSPDSDYWYHGLGQQSIAGPNVSPGSATRLSAVYACTRVCAETLSSLPIAIFRERKSGGRDPAPDHPAMELFNQPNPWQTMMEFVEMMQGHLELRGNAYALKVPCNGRAIGELIPLHPDRVRVYLLPDNRLRYEVTSYSTGQIDRYSMDEILHLKAWSFDGIMGVSTVSAMAETIGVGLAQQEHRGRFFHAPFPGMSIETVKMNPEDTEELKLSLAEGLSGRSAYTAMILPPGMKATTMALTNKDSQMIEASNATTIDICGGWRVPPHKVGNLAKGTFSNIEQQNIEFATDCMRPRVVRLERRFDLSIVMPLRAFESASGDYFAVVNMNELYRGDMKSRYEAYAQAISAGWMIPNEARASEGLNPIKGLDEPRIAVNMETISQAQKRSDANVAAASVSTEENDTQKELDQGGGGTETPEQDETDPDDPDGANAILVETKLRALAVASAGRIVRREVKAMRKLAVKADGGPAIDAEIREFYRNLAPVVAESLAIPSGVAVIYCNLHAAAIATSRAALLDLAIDKIEEEGPVTLADYAMGERKERKSRVQ